MKDVKRDVEKQSADEEKEKKAKLNVLDKAANLEPKDVLKNMVLQTIQESKASNGKKGKGKGSQHHVDYAAAAAGGYKVTEDMIEKKAADPKRKCTKTQVAERKNRDPSLTKNGQSPQEAGGHTAKKGKGKGQKGGKASGKGKGKSKNKAEQKGKGKGAPSGAKSKGRGNGGKGNMSWW